MFGREMWYVNTIALKSTTHFFQKINTCWVLRNEESEKGKNES